MSIIQCNLQSLTSNREQVRVLFNDFNPSAICLQETKLGDFTPNMGHNFNFFRSPPMQGDRAHGGTAIIVRKDINCKVVQLNTILQCNAIQFFANKWITLCSLYLEPTLERRLFDINGQPRQFMTNDLQNLVDQLPPPFILPPTHGSVEVRGGA